eukprot:522497-Pyramimonas_sp.AAC.1
MPDLPICTMISSMFVSVRPRAFQVATLSGVEARLEAAASGRGRCTGGSRGPTRGPWGRRRCGPRVPPNEWRWH